MSLKLHFYGAINSLVLFLFTQTKTVSFLAFWICQGVNIVHQANMGLGGFKCNIRNWINR
jgi:hypothetical protein